MLAWARSIAKNGNDIAAHDFVEFTEFRFGNGVAAIIFCLPAIIFSWSWLTLICYSGGYGLEGYLRGINETTANFPLRFQ